MTRKPLLAPAGLLVLGLALAHPAGAGFLNGVTSPDGVDVIAVGDSGMVYRSVDGGLSYVKSYQGTTPLRAVASNGGTILMVGDGGKIVRSADNGISWTTATAAGSPNLYGVELVSASRAYVVGANGTVLRSTDGGANWTPLTSGTSSALRNLRFVDASNGWIVGDGGFIRSTADGGDNWSTTPLTTANALYAIDQLGARVWAAGANGSCWKSVNGGTSWTPVNLRIDSRSDVRAVCLQSADSVFISGGGGFIRRSVDDGATWTFPIHPLMGEVSDMCLVGSRGWVTSIRSPSVMRTADRGTSWAFATGTVIARSWNLKQTLVAGSQRGSSVCLNPIYRNTLYCALGSNLYVSRDDGETWTQFASIPGTRVNAMVMSPKDSLKITLTSSSPQQILYSNNGGANWNLSTNGAHAYGEYGIPIEMHPDKPDTLFFGGDNDLLMRSTDFGKSWATFGTKTFRSPCDLIVVPESDSNQVIVGDGITGSGIGDLWRSVDGGLNFTKQYTTSGSEIPGMSMGRLNNKRAFATNWSSGGVEQSINAGLIWTQIQTTGSAWGTDVCKEDPNVVIYGVYSGGLGYLSLDGGATWSSASLSGSNYSFYARDRGCILAEQGGGLYKLASTYTYTPSMLQFVTVNAPNGGETWDAGSTHDITWNSTNVAMARIEYRRTPSDPWVLVADVPGYYGRYAWTCPWDATSSAAIRVSDAVDAAPIDASNAAFTIALPLIAAAPGSLDFGTRNKGYAALDSVLVSNPGTALLHMTSATTGTAFFSPSPSSFSLTPGTSSWVRVTFLPNAARTYDDQLTIASDGYNAPSTVIPLTGAGQDTVRLDLMSPNGGETFAYGSSQKVAWQAEVVANVDIDYRISPVDPWLPLASGLTAAGGTWQWTIPDAPTTTGRLRVRESGGPAVDLSAADFSIVVPRLDLAPNVELDLGKTAVGVTRCDTLHLSNPGTAPVTISLVASSRPTFWAERGSITIPAGGADTLGICFSSAAAGPDTATFTLAADDPANPHTLRVVCEASAVTAVEGGTPAEFGLWQNQPNPFTGSTLLHYALPRAAHVSLEVFNLMGQRVATVVDREQDPGDYRLTFAPRRTDGSRLPSGVYFYRFRAGPFAATRKMLLMN